MASSENQMRDRTIKLEREVETFRRDMDIDRDMTHLKSSSFFRNSTPAGTPMPPTKTANSDKSFSHKSSAIQRHGNRRFFVVVTKLRTNK